MREKLEQNNGIRSRYAGTFEKFGKKSGWNHPEPTVLLVNIRDDSQNLITDHLWFNYTKEFRTLWESKLLKPGSIIEFFGRVNPYEKGYQGYRDCEDPPQIETDYKLSRPTRVKIIGFDLNYGEMTCDPPYEFSYPKNEYLNFSHDYTKLHNPKFTTVRGTNAFQYYDIGSHVKILLNSEFLFTAEIEDILQVNLRSLPLDLLKADAEYPGFTIASYEEFIDLLNSFRRESNQINDSNPIVTVIWLKWIKEETKQITESPIQTPQVFKALDLFIKNKGVIT